MKTNKNKMVLKQIAKDFDSKFFLILLSLFSIIVLVKLAINSNTYNPVDNRSSYKFVMPKIDTILSGEFQKSFEEAITDQMPKYNIFKLAYLKAKNYINFKSYYLFGLNKFNKYVKVGNVFLYKDYLVYNTTNNNDFALTAENDVKEINKLVNETNASIYLYFVETDNNYNFETNYKVNSMKYLKENLQIDNEKIDSYNISSFDDYKDYFYRTDHHWNYKGSYKAYKEIAKLMNFNNQLVPKEEICFKGIPSSGSKSKSLAGINIIYDTMCVYDFDFPKFQIYADGIKIDKYGSSINDLYHYNSIAYGDIYGTDFGELIFKNEEENNNKNLLIYANSYSNAINKLLASNYKNTYVIDGRYFNKHSMVEYIKLNEIDDVLILGNCMLFWDDIKW